MSKTIKQSILILGVLVALSVAFAIVFYLQKQAAETRIVDLNGQISTLETKERETQKKLKVATEEAAKLSENLNVRTSELDAMTKKSAETAIVAENLRKDVASLKKSSEDIEVKLGNVRREREALMQQISDMKNKPPVEKIVYREQSTSGTSTGSTDGVSAAQAMDEVFNAAAGSTMPRGINRENENYWAGILRQKASLELELQKMRDFLGNSNVQMAELKKANSDLEMELGRIRNEKDEIVRKIKYGEDLADNLSVELARARNEQKISQDRAEQILSENQKLRQDIKQLTTTKVSLEKSIANLSEEKNAIEKKLVETENVIQGRIDEIWQIKNDIDVRFENRVGTQNSSQVDLAPIVVGVNKNDVGEAKTTTSAKSKSIAASKKLQGSIVSINDENNFVIVDLGEKSGIKVGDALKVYHAGTQVGAVEVIQVRQDISAADIKQRVSAFSVGDTVR